MENKIDDLEKRIKTLENLHIYGGLLLISILGYLIYKNK